MQENVQEYTERAAEIPPSRPHPAGSFFSCGNPISTVGGTRAGDDRRDPGLGPLVLAELLGLHQASAPEQTKIFREIRLGVNALGKTYGFVFLNSRLLRITIRLYISTSLVVFPLLILRV